MDTIVINFEGNTVVVTNGRQTDTVYFNKITYEPEQALIALARYYGYEPAELFNFDNETMNKLNKF